MKGSVREATPTENNSSRRESGRRLEFVGIYWGELLAVSARVPLITQRPLVQIQPPQPNNSSGWKGRLGAAPFVYPGITQELAPRLELG